MGPLSRKSCRAARGTGKVRSQVVIGIGKPLMGVGK